MTQLAESLKKCKVEGNILFLPPISEGMLPNYNEVRTALLKAGAKYKRNSFVFPNDAQPYIDRLTGGESVNIKKEFQFFGTPNDLADELVELADLKPGMLILEPSAGQGAIIKAIYRARENVSVDYCELMDINQAVLSKYFHETHINFLCADFLELKSISKTKYDRIIANPPFNKNQDIQHIKEMYTHLKKGGRIVSMASKHWQFSQNKKETDFRDWLGDIGADIIDVEAGRFEESGTKIATCIIIINK